MPGKYYLTTPLYYVNSKPHIGHAYTQVAADVLARYQRLVGNEVKFLTGTDEHGQKVEKAARDAGMEPQPFTDRMSGVFRELWKTLNSSALRSRVTSKRCRRPGKRFPRKRKFIGALIRDGIAPPMKHFGHKDRYCNRKGRSFVLIANVRLKK